MYVTLMESEYTRSQWGCVYYSDGVRIQSIPIVGRRRHTVTSPGRTGKKPKDLSTCESEERGCGSSGCVYATLMESDEIEHRGPNRFGVDVRWGPTTDVSGYLRKFTRRIPTR